MTNWSMFAKPNQIEGCVEDVHFPLGLADAALNRMFRLFRIFRAGDGKIGICYPKGVLSSAKKKKNEAIGGIRMLLICLL